VYAPGPERDEAAEAIAAFNRVVVADPRVDVVLVPFRDGISLIQHR
jgi:caffeoyl-CoA O-methyltransferase